MPSADHEAPLDLFRARPALVEMLLRDSLGIELPPHARVRVASSDWTELPQYRPDLVVVFEDEAAVVRMAVAVELQRAVDADKVFRWPLYAAALRARHRCAAALLVVAPDEKVARWAERPIAGVQPGSPFTPLVVGPEQIPLVLSEAEARAAPELAVLSAMAHWREFPDTLDPVVVTLDALDELPPEIRELYSHLTVAVLSPAALDTLRMIMATHPRFISDFGRMFIEEGRIEGRREEQLASRREVLLRILETRGLTLTGDQRARIEACTEKAALDAWIERAITATTPTAIFETQ